ncbi:ROK family protein [Caballeronia sp. LZ043]|uniref:ROK family protein n=1 Tax=Caballeronia sp. LZ043 TaxID=3038569 RepID=UPI00285552E3|nr:ROK family protein [Caballeronia sp. LZ043]MDR5826202.1 ROK family protein [Caballeronia sp. LZ043]
MTVTESLLRDEMSTAVLAIDIGGTHIKLGYALGATALDYQRLFSTDELRVGDPIGVLVRMIRTAFEETGVRAHSIVVAVPGFIDSDGDRILHAENVSSLDGIALASELRSRTQCDVLLERDAVLTLIGEIEAGAGRNADHILGVFFGTGIGAAFISGGTPFRGAGWALEVGAMPFRIDQYETDAGPYDQRSSCLEAFASGYALRAIAQRHEVAIEKVFLAIDTGSQVAEELSIFVNYQAIAISIVIATMCPSTVLLGGGVLDMKGYPRAKLFDQIRRYAPHSMSPDLRWCELGWGAVIHGALALHRRASRVQKVLRS